MLPLRYASRWRTASLVLLVLVLAAAVMPAVWLWPDRDFLYNWFDAIDKSTHAIVFAFLAVWFAGQYRPQSYWRIALGLLMFGLLIELCQRMLVYRSAEWLDVAADVVGIIGGLLIAAAGLGGWCQRVEARYMTERDSRD